MNEACPHQETIEVTEFNRDDAEELCLDCGATIATPREPLDRDHLAAIADPA